MKCIAIIPLCVFISWLTAHSLINYFTLDAPVSGVRMAIFFRRQTKILQFTILYTLVSNDQSPWLKSVLCIILYIKYPNS